MIFPLPPKCVFGSNGLFTLIPLQNVSTIPHRGGRNIWALAFHAKARAFKIQYLTSSSRTKQNPAPRDVKVQESHGFWAGRIYDFKFLEHTSLFLVTSTRYWLPVFTQRPGQQALPSSLGDELIFSLRLVWFKTADNAGRGSYMGRSELQKHLQVFTHCCDHTEPIPLIEIGFHHCARHPGVFLLWQNPSYVEGECPSNL